MKLSKKQINDMAQDLEMGMKIYLNPKNLEYKSIPDDDIMMDSGPWEEDMEEIDYEWPGFILIEKMNSREACKIMEDFVEEMEDSKFREDLTKILARKSPFANFKAEIEYSNYRDAWFKFRTWRHEEYIKEMLKMEGIDYELI